MDEYSVRALEEPQGRMDIDPDLIDRLYEAAFVPELWPGVLDQLGAVTGSPSGGLVVYEDTKPVRFVANEFKLNSMEEFVSGDLWEDNQRIQYFHQHPFTGFVAADQYYSREFLEQDAVHVINRRTGLGAQIGTMVPMPSGELVVYAFERWWDDEPYDADDIRMMNEVHPHLARAGLMAARLRVEQARNTAFAFQTIGLPVAVFSSAGRVRATNELLDAMTTVFLPTAFGGMAIADPAANGLFRQAIEAAASDAEAVVRSIPVRAAGGEPPLVIHVLPLRRSAHDIFSGADIIVAATAVSASSLVPSPGILTGLFDLAPSEARLAVALTEGRSLKAFAAEAGITFGTARKYLDRIYLKTGTHSQGQLVALLKGVQPLDPAV